MGNILTFNKGNRQVTIFYAAPRWAPHLAICGALLAALAAPAQAAQADAAAATPAPYRLKEAQPRVGSRILSDIASSSLPMTAYADFSDAEKRRVKSAYDNMADDDEPPYPLFGTRKLFEAMSAIGGKFLAEGELKMRVEINSEGVAQSVEVFKSPDPDVTKYAAMVLIAQKYKPALCHGVPCAQQFPWDVKFVRH